MATIEVINYCNEVLLDGWKEVRTDKPSKVDLDFFGIDVKVKEAELVDMSKVEKQRHINQDILLLRTYRGRKSETPRRLRAKIIATARKTIVTAEILAEGL
ncbi:hypothetical protein GO491_03240 [Flavobacteriaceae bacterium Ap0902]|nr:hypothetical protein [Flavobacteriaceae bacterium Ap0902]